MNLPAHVAGGAIAYNFVTRSSDRALSAALRNDDAPSPLLDSNRPLSTAIE